MYRNFFYHTVLLLVLGLSILGILFALITFQFFQLPKDMPPIRNMQPRMMIKMLTKPISSPEELQRKLSRFPQLKVKVTELNKQSLKKYKHYYQGVPMPPMDIFRPFVISRGNTHYLIEFSPVWHINLLSILYICVMLLLITMMIFWCFWMCRRLTRPYLMVSSAMKEMKDNIHSSLSLSHETKITKSLSNDILQIQNLLQEMLKRRTTMLAAISHDLKTPMTRLKLRVELLSSSEVKNKLLLDIDEIENMINSIMLFSQTILSDEIVVQFNLSELLKSICHDAEDFGHKISFSIEPDILFNGKLISIKRALNNILDNSIKHGKHNVEMSLSRKPNEQIVCEIKDQGPGVQPNSLDKLFVPFYREDKARTEPGSGLGLSIAKEIIETHGGRIQISGNLPSGLIVQIIFNKINDLEMGSNEK